ncbi:MAG: alkaline phosphatase family protein [Dehalococcoidia bacterium]|nr:alkaline phosphatase family protein [Dehalococcoidia bacterium]MDW8120626.1 alkaline phosphatase family protein [Chloroflexota bacterium]
MPPLFVLCIDGLDIAYLDASPTPTLDALKRAAAHPGDDAYFRMGRGMLPSVTNVNMTSILTGLYPRGHGIVSNFWLDGGAEVYMEDASYLLAPTLLRRVAQRGGRSALLVAKQKLRTLLDDGATFATSAEQPAPWAVEGAGPPPAIYTAEVNLWLFDAALALLRREALDLCVIITTDYPMHAWPPEDARAIAYIQGLDRNIGALLEAFPSATLLLTADHGMNAKTVGVDLGKLLARGNIPCRVLPIIKDRYVVHHQNLGGAAYIYLENPADRERALEALRECPHVEMALPREEAAQRFRLHPQRIGDILVLADREAVFGPLHKEVERVAVRSHGSLHETFVPLLAHNARGFRAQENRQLGEWVAQRLGL